MERGHLKITDRKQYNKERERVDNNKNNEKKN